MGYRTLGAREGGSLASTKAVLRDMSGRAPGRNCVRQPRRNRPQMNSRRLVGVRVLCNRRRGRAKTIEGDAVEGASCPIEAIAPCGSSRRPGRGETRNQAVTSADGCNLCPRFYLLASNLQCSPDEPRSDRTFLP